MDVRDEPLPPDEVIENPGGETTSEEVVVQCLLAARLVPVGDDLVVESEDDADWIYREFTPTGVVEWAWSVTATTPRDQQLRLDLRPAVRVDGSPTEQVTQVASFTTQVAVDATVLERASYWFETQWPKLAGIALILGGAILAVKAYGRKLFARNTRAGKDKADIE